MKLHRDCCILVNSIIFNLPACAISVFNFKRRLKMKERALSASQGQKLNFSGVKMNGSELELCNGVSVFGD